MSDNTTIEILKIDLSVWRRWCKTTGRNSTETFHRIIEEAKLKHIRELYLSLPDPSGIKVNKSLKNMRLQKNYRKRNGIALVRQFARENGHSEGGTMDQYLYRLEERATASVA